MSESETCPECGSEVEEKNPLLGLWMCDECEIGFNENGDVVAN
jgi:ribosomal protein L37AE/L43A